MDHRTETGAFSIDRALELFSAKCMMEDGFCNVDKWSCNVFVSKQLMIQSNFLQSHNPTWYSSPPVNRKEN